MPTITALGTTLDATLPDRTLSRADFDHVWSRCLDPRGTPARSADIEADTLVAVTQVITRELIAAQRGRLLMLHAGAVAHPDTGTVLAYVAPGGTGKTTLTTLLARTFGYVTDETVGVDPATLDVFAYPKPLSVRGEAGAKTEHSPDDLGLLAAPPHLRLASLAVLRRDPSLDAPRVTALSAVDAILMMVPESSSLSELQRPLHLLRDVHARLGGIELVEYAESDTLAGWAAERLGAS